MSEAGCFHFKLQSRCSHTMWWHHKSDNYIEDFDKATLFIGWPGLKKLQVAILTEPELPDICNMYDIIPIKVQPL